MNCELTTKIEQLQSKAPYSTTNDSLVKKNGKLKAKLASSQDTIENLLEKMEILSIHNNKLTTKLENIDSTQDHLLLKFLKSLRKLFLLLALI
jgi:FtsZ-binding cell division protein ZapB